MKPLRIPISSDMQPLARREVIRRLREGTVRRRFRSVTDYTQEQNDLVGFVGEIAARAMLDLDFRDVRASYAVPDHFDVEINGWMIDVKTESVPTRGDDPFRRLVEGRIAQGASYYSRWYNAQQVELLREKHIAIFGVVPRHLPYRDPDEWWFLGWIEAAKVPRAPIVGRGDTAAHAIPNDWLHDLTELKETLKLPPRGR